MSIFASNAIRDYMISKGVNSTLAANMQTYVLRIETAGLITAKDKAMISILEKVIRPVIDIGFATYGLGYNAGQIATYIGTYLPQYAGSATLYSNIVVTDINTNMVGTPAAEGYYTAIQAYVADIVKVLTPVAKYMRYFVQEAGMVEFVGVISPATVL